MENSTEIVFLLPGLNATKSNKHAYFVVALLAYIFTILVNLALIVTIVLHRVLHEPMFIFLCNLCANGIFGVSTFYPKILVDFLSDVNVTPYKACLAQMFVIYSYAFCEMTTLAVMAYDRYIAICKPLNYHSIITPRRVANLLILTWLSSICESVVVVALIARLPLCGFKIDKLYCTGWAVVKLSCVDTTINNIYGSVLMFIHVSEALVILFSYVNIVKASLRSQEERNKFMQTCLPHLISLGNFAFAGVFDIMYARYGSSTRLLGLSHFMSLEYLVVPPLLNPLMYGLKLKQIRQRIFRHLRKERPQRPHSHLINKVFFPSWRDRRMKMNIL
ncbi:olfactory receptor 2G6-like [Conger conger]|uniref:olfactory receptor 2G6-like n=1 Tax=Conger conger TaxID=82655 RepID=UPI002A5ACCBD|nr:olfactory receptor 2G6-like [Conger conger]